MADPPRSSSFPATRWSMISAAADSPAAPETRAALEDLCKTYWYPIYGFLRRQGRAPADAEDLTQAFFAKLLAGDLLARASPDRGKLRSFLLTVLKRFVNDESEKATALKRGGDCQFVAMNAEDRVLLEPADTATPEDHFARRWALTVLENVIATLRAEYVESGRTEVYDALQPFLTDSTGNYAEAADKLGMKEATVRVAVFRFRRRYGELLRAHIADTVDSPDDVADELDFLMRSLSR